MRRYATAAFICVTSMTIFVSCGISGGEPQPTPSGGGQAPTFDEVKPVLDANCSRCHNGSVQPTLTEESFKGAHALQLVDSGAMPPPPATLSKNDRAMLVSYLEAHH